MTIILISIILIENTISANDTEDLHVYIHVCNLVHMHVYAIVVQRR